MASEMIQSRKAWSVLIVSTLAFTVCFMVWMMFGVIGIPLKKTLGLNATEFGLLMATPRTGDSALVGRAMDEMAALAHGGNAKLALAQLGRLVPEFTHEAAAPARQAEQQR